MRAEVIRRGDRVAAEGRLGYATTTQRGSSSPTVRVRWDDDLDGEEQEIRTVSSIRRLEPDYSSPQALYDTAPQWLWLDLAKEARRSGDPARGWRCSQAARSTGPNSEVKMALCREEVSKRIIDSLVASKVYAARVPWADDWMDTADVLIEVPGYEDFYATAQKDHPLGNWRVMTTKDAPADFTSLAFDRLLAACEGSEAELIEAVIKVMVERLNKNDYDILNEDGEVIR